jgi:phosphoribosylpyrophosphate synthetase
MSDFSTALPAGTRAGSVAVFDLNGVGDPIFDLEPVRGAIELSDTERFKKQAKKIERVQFDEELTSTDLVRALRADGAKVVFITPIPRRLIDVLIAKYGLEVDLCVAEESNELLPPDAGERSFSCGLDAVLTEFPDHQHISVFSSEPGALDEVSRRHAAGDARFISLARRRQTNELAARERAADVSWGEPRTLLAAKNLNELRYLGEIESSGFAMADLPVHGGNVISDIDGEYRLFALGRYYAKTRNPELYAVHRHTRRILDQKSTDTPLFMNSFLEFVRHLKQKAEVHSVWSVPSFTPHGTDRFQWYRDAAMDELDAEECAGIEEVRPLAGRLRDMGHDQRRSANANRFGASGDLSGQTVLLIDDIWATGSTLEAAERAAMQAGATRTIKLVFGFTQDKVRVRASGWYQV